MCTVSLLPVPTTGNGFILTANRDEDLSRTAKSPEFITHNKVKMLFPTDIQSGGTWIGLSERQRSICLLNGGLEPHKQRGPYRKSRGVVVRDFLAAADLDQAIASYNLDNIEPFTLISADWMTGLRFIEFVWDGEQKHLRDLDLKSHFWSSAMLYNKDMHQQRESWFIAMLHVEEFDASPQSLWEFHHKGGIGDKNIDVIMDRGQVKTQSVTQIIHLKGETEMIYEDLQTNKITENTFGYL